MSPEVAVVAAAAITAVPATVAALTSLTNGKRAKAAHGELGMKLDSVHEDVRDVQGEVRGLRARVTTVEDHIFR